MSCIKNLGDLAWGVDIDIDFIKKYYDYCQERNWDKGKIYADIKRISEPTWCDLHFLREHTGWNEFNNKFRYVPELPKLQEYYFPVATRADGSVINGDNDWRFISKKTTSNWQVYFTTNYHLGKGDAKKFACVNGTYAGLAFWHSDVSITSVKSKDVKCTIDNKFFSTISKIDKGNFMDGYMSLGKVKKLAVGRKLYYVPEDGKKVLIVKKYA